MMNSSWQNYRLHKGGMEVPTKIVEVENITFQYDLRVDKKTLDNISFHAYKGEWLAIVGNNGSGKSTLAQMLIGLLEPHQGKITISGMELNEETKWDIRQKVGLVFQNPDNQFIGTTVQDDVAFGLENVNMPYAEMKERVEEALQMVDMVEFRNHDSSNLSGGQKQRVAIAGVLALKPHIIILDEALVMIDPKSRIQLLNTLHELKDKHQITIISITHDMSEAQLADRLIRMDAGKIVNTGPPEKVFLEEKSLEPPFAEQLRRSLQAKGRKVPNKYMTEDEMVRWLCI